MGFDPASLGQQFLGPALAFFAGAAVVGLAIGRLVRGRTVAAIADHLEALVDPATRSRRLRPIADRRAAALIERLGARLAEVETLARTDQLTGVLNRPTSLRQLASEVERASRYDRPLSVALADIDHFKRVNDTYGHLAGDLVLRHVAQLLRGNVRTNDVIGRYGGEEFVLILPETDVEAAASVVEKLRRLVGRTAVTLPDGTDLTVTVSVGLAGAAGPGLRLDEITRDADTALYAAKSLGRDQVYVFKALDDDRAIHRAPLSAKARAQALDVGRVAASAAQDALAGILAARPNWAGRPSELIAELSVGLAHALGLPDGEVARIRTASLLHDVGKVAISEALLSKPSELSDSEWRSVMEHPKIGQIVLEQAGAIRDASTIALHHHEWFNGRGYPHGLAGGEIPIGARIVAIADAYEAMTSWRPYQRTKTHEEALAELRRCAGTQFDPDLVEMFVACFPETAARNPEPELRTGTDG